MDCRSAVQRTLEKLGIPAPHSIVGMITIEQLGRRPWTIAARGQTGCGTASPTRMRERIVNLALNEPTLSPRELAMHSTNTERYFVSEAFRSIGC